MAEDTDTEAVSSDAPAVESVVETGRPVWREYPLPLAYRPQILRPPRIPGVSGTPLTGNAPGSDMGRLDARQVLSGGAKCGPFYEYPPEILLVSFPSA